MHALPSAQPFRSSYRDTVRMKLLPRYIQRTTRGRSRVVGNVNSRRWSSRKPTDYGMVADLRKIGEKQRVQRLATQHGMGTQMRLVTLSLTTETRDRSRAGGLLNPIWLVSPRPCAHGMPSGHPPSAWCRRASSPGVRPGPVVISRKPHVRQAGPGTGTDEHGEPGRAVTCFERTRTKMPCKAAEAFREPTWRDVAYRQV